MLVIRQRFANLAKNRFRGRVWSFFRDLAMVGHRIPTGGGLNWGKLGRLCTFSWQFVWFGHARVWKLETQSRSERRVAQGPRSKSTKRKSRTRLSSAIRLLGAAFLNKDCIRSTLCVTKE